MPITEGSWKPGQSGNPKGRPPGVLARDMARALTPKAIAALEKALEDKRTMVQAAAVLLDRGWGKPKEQVEQLNINVDAMGIDAPPLPETLEDWLDRRHAELRKQLQ